MARTFGVRPAFFFGDHDDSQAGRIQEEVEMLAMIRDASITADQLRDWLCPMAGPEPGSCRGAAAAAGVLAGGIPTARAGWRWVFFATVPLKARHRPCPAGELLTVVAAI